LRNVKDRLRAWDFKEILAVWVFRICACGSIAAIALICLFLFLGGGPAIIEIGLTNFLFGRSWAPLNIPAEFGVLPMIAGSVYITVGAVIIGVPIGIFTAVFLAFMCPKKLHKLLKPIINLLAGIPSVVYGFFGMRAIVPVIRNISLALTDGGSGASILSASVLLGIMILPTIIAISESSIRAISKEYYEGALALGASHVRSVFFVVVPAAKSGILASVVLGIGRAVGETMAVVMVAGNQAMIPIFPEGIFRGGRSLTANIVLEMAYATDLHRDALIATAIVLFCFIFLINIIFTFLVRKDKN